MGTIRLRRSLMIGFALIGFTIQCAIPTSLAQTPGLVANDAPENVVASPAEIRQWVQQLDSNSYESRKLATNQLQRVGEPAVAAIIQAVQANASAEVLTRAFRILRTIAFQTDLMHESAATVALAELANQRGTSVARRAESVLQTLAESRAMRCQTALQELGATFDLGVRAPTQTGEFVSKQISNRVMLGPKWKGTAADLGLLKHLTSFDFIECTGSEITDDYLKEIGQLEWVRWLVLRKAIVSDDGILHLAQLKDLQLLVVWYSPITDASLRSVSQLSRAEAIQLFGTKISLSASEELQKQMVGTHVDVRRGGFLGVAGLRAPLQVGCEITQPTPGSAAAKAGLQTRDIIIRYDGQRVTEFLELKDLIARNAAGDKVEVDILRRDKQLTKTVELGEWSTFQLP